MKTLLEEAETSMIQTDLQVEAARRRIILPGSSRPSSRTEIDDNFSARDVSSPFPDSSVVVKTQRIVTPEVCELPTNLLQSSSSVLLPDGANLPIANEHLLLSENDNKDDSPQMLMAIKNTNNNYMGVLGGDDTNLKLLDMFEQWSESSSGIALDAANDASDAAAILITDEGAFQ